MLEIRLIESPIPPPDLTPSRLNIDTMHISKVSQLGSIRVSYWPSHDPSTIQVSSFPSRWKAENENMLSSSLPPFTHHMIWLVSLTRSLCWRTHNPVWSTGRWGWTPEWLWAWLTARFLWHFLWHFATPLHDIWCQKTKRETTPIVRFNHISLLTSAQ